MNEIIKALALSQRAMLILGEELDRQSRAERTVGTTAQLEACKQQLVGMVAQLESGHLPRKEQRLCGMGHMIADSWPVDSKLGEALLLAEQAYRSVP